MIRVYGMTEGRLAPRDHPAPDAAFPPDTVWVDLIAPTEAEEQAVERRFHVDIPTREAREEIESSSRLYEQKGAALMTATLVRRADTPRPESAVVSFVLSGGVLVTVRYEELKPFDSYLHHAMRQPAVSPSAESVLAGLLDAIVDRLADILEGVGTALDEVSQEAFAREAPSRGRELQALLGRVGRSGDLISKVSESLISLTRVITFARQLDAVRTHKTAAARFKTVAQDAASLNDHAGFLNSKVGFLLDAIFGMISIEQNATIKMFSVVAVIFLPPTLIASIYGMNFAHMPELDWLYGYPLALAAMVVSAIVPYALFKLRGWL